MKIDNIKRVMRKRGLDKKLEVVVVCQDLKSGEYNYTEEQKEKVNRGAKVVHITYQDKGLL